MEVKEFINTLEKMNFSLSVRDGKLNLRGNKRKLSKEELEAIKTNKDVINYITKNRDKLIEYISAFPEISLSKKSEDIISIYRLSGLQQGMLFHGLYDERSGGYIEQLSCDLSGLNLKVLLDSWSEVIKHHSILRSAFYYDSFSVPVQCVFREVKLPLEELDYREMGEAAQEEALKAYEAADRTKGFDFKSPPLMRLCLIRLDEERYRMVWTSHHILFDGWSLPILMEEFLTTYELLLSGQTPPEEEEDRYEDYIRYLERKDKETEEDYWRDYLQGIEQGTLLPFVKTTADRTKGIGKYESLSIVLDGDRAAQIQDFAQSNRITINTLMQGVWAWLLHRYTGSNAVVYGVVVSGRPAELPGVERRVGMYINTLPFKAVTSKDQDTISWLQGLQADQVSSRQYQYTALQDVQEWTGIKGDLFDSILVFENYPVNKLVASRKWSLQVENVAITEQTNYPFTVTAEISEKLNIIFGYNTNLLEQAYVEDIRDQFEQVLLQIVDGQAGTLGDIRLLTKAQEHQVLEEFKATDVAFPKDTNIVSLIEEQAAKNPDATAVVFEDKELTYGELNKRSNQLAHYLQKKGVKAETLVPICVERSPEMVIGILGILKAGGAYVPIDPEYPQDRISYMLEDTGAQIILSSKAGKEKLSTTAAIIELDSDWEQIEKEKDSNLQTGITPNQLAYVIYTSGSTGKPKGVLIEHGGFAASTLARNSYYPEVKAQFLISSYAFDSSVAVIFGTLTTGGSLILCKDELLKDTEHIKGLLSQTDSILCVPSYYRFLLEEKLLAGSRLSRVILAGEKLTNDLVAFHYKETKGVSLFNEYGPTENTVWATVAAIKSAAGIIPIGKPIANTWIYILSEDKELTPLGVTGEICIGGAGLARGYLNRADLTAEKFIPDPFSKDKEAKLYKTGDLGRWLPDGSIEYQGRIDDQVKIRGYRIELGEIEQVLNESELVNQAVVLAREDSGGNNRLVGYVVPNGTFDRQEIQNYLSSKLPEYMVPALWVELSSIPLTSNGKIDKKALPDPELTDRAAEYIAPRNETEAKLAKIWQELLGVERVGINDNFFELGGQSLLAMRVVSAIRRELNIEIAIKDLFVYPTIASLTAQVDLQGSGIVVPAIKTVLPRPEYIPLSFGQERLWFIDQLEGTIQYHLPTVLRLQGELKPEILEQTLRAIISRHEALRTVIREHEGQGYQQIMSADGWTLGITEDLRTENLSSYISDLISKPFDLSADYMLRADLIELGDQDYVLVVTMHHIASDGWSRSILVKEVIALYEAFTTGNEAKLPKLPILPIQYTDYAIWQRNYMQGEVLENKLSYWKKKLENVIPLQLPSDYNRPTIHRLRGATQSFYINKDLSDRLQALSHRYGATLYMTLLAAFKVLLYRYSGQEDICVGTSVANRPQQELEELIGFFVNTLALRSQVKGEIPFSELLEEVKTTTLEAYAHQDVPFEKVVDAVVKGRDMSRHPLFQVLFSLQNVPETPELKLGNLILMPEDEEHTTSRFDMTFTISETSTGIQGTVEYNTDLYSSARIERMTLHFTELLKSVVAAPETQVGKLEMLSLAEQATVLGYGQSASTYPQEATVADLFEAKAQQFPDREAVVFAGKAISYKELNERANKLAHRLQELGVKEDTLVPLYAERGLDMLTGILGILKAGGAYVPVDTEFPEERVSYMLEDTGAKVAVSSGEYAEQLQQLAPGNLAVIETDNNSTEENITNPERNLRPEHLAYVIYTSGSTGKPKGVELSHRNLVDYVYGLDERTGISKNRSYALVSTIATDLGNTVLFSSLIFGGTLHVFSRETVSHIEELHEYFSDHRIDCLKIVPSHWKALSPDDGPPLLPEKMLFFGGEALPIEQAARIRRYSGDVRVFNHYGPTETTVGKLVYELGEEAPEGIIPVGKPFSNTAVYILSKEGMLCPVGVPGELHIAGAGVAKGYLNRKELTAEKFIKDPRGEKAGTRMYRTGDQVRYQQDGNIIFIGRVDDQVKIRGYRVEPGEVGRILEESELVSQAVVIARADKQGNNQLVGYVVPNGTFDKQELQNYLKAQLPDYMVPAHIIELTHLPLTANGKIDRKALPDPDNTQQATGGYTAPTNETEAKLAAIWQDLLGLEQVGINDNFFEIGGHSLLAMRVVSMIRRDLNVELSIRNLFVYPSIADLGTYLDKQNKGSLLPAITAEVRPEYIPLSFSQERLWFIDRLEGSVQYNVPSVLRLKGNLNHETLQRTLRTIINRHEVLRTVILEHKGQGYQQIIEADSWTLGIIEESGYKRSEASLSALITNLINKPFDLSTDYMLRADLIRLGDQDHILVVTMHHIASDGWSRSILVKEVISLYEEFTERKAARLPLLPVQYADYAIWQQKYMQGEVLQNKLGYWKKKLDGVAPIQLPSDYTRPLVQSSHGAIRSFKIDPDLSAKVVDLSQRQGTTLFMTALAAFKVLLYRYSGNEDICVGTPVAGRSQLELEELIGFFINTLALRSQVKGSITFTELLQEVKSMTLEAYEHQEVPFEKVVDAVVKERDMSRNPLFQVLFTLQNTPEVPELKLGELKWIEENQRHTTSKFDLAFLIIETSTGIHGAVEYSTDLYREETIERMIDHYINLLSSIVASPESKVGCLDMLSAVEKHTLLVDFNDTQADYPKNKNIVDLFREQVIKNPEAIAIIYEDQELNYKELNKRSNQLAHYLQSKGVQEKTLVPICLERNLEMIVGILGIMKAGGVYVPIDPAYPKDRISFMIGDTEARMVLSSRSGRSKIREDETVKIIELDGDWDMISEQSSADIRLNTQPGDLAYVVYTSGSTGKPKGVMIKHQSLVNLVAWHNLEYKVTEGSKAVSMAGVGFDAFGWEIWPYLSAGASIYVIDDETRLSVATLSALFIDKEITHSFISTALVQDFVNASRHKEVALKYLLTGGDKLSALNLDGICYILANNYGPTENTVVATSCIVSQKDKIPPIGKPISNTRIYILSVDEELSPVGVSGEVCIGGAGLALGYLNRPELTAEKFIKDPFNSEPGACLYKTGDLARWLPEGNIEYLGRMDDQVKIRGYRIELGEIESVLNKSELVSQAIVLAKEDGIGNKRLVGYIVSEGTFDKQAVQGYLGTKLPEYMIPAIWVELDRLPLTPNGKIDRKALPDPELTDVVTEYVAPRNETEEKLASIWQNLLVIDRVGIYDNFFERGGHSLLAMRVVSAIRKELDIEVAIKDLFVYSTIASLAAHLDLHNGGILIPAIEVINPRPEYIPLSFSQERLWFIDRLEGSVQYHIPAVLRLKGSLDREALEKTLRAIIRRHEVLRTMILERAGNGYQQIVEANSWTLGVTEDLQKEKAGDLSSYITRLINKPFNLSADYMLRADLIKLGQQDHMLVVTMHHIASDGWSTSVLVKEVITLYKSYAGNEEINLPGLKVQYADYAIWQRNYMKGEVLENKLNYWKMKLEGIAPLQLPLDYSRPAIQSSHGATRSFNINKELSVLLQTMSQRQGATTYMTLLTAFKVLLYRYSGQEDICVGTPVAGRNQQELEELIGFFVNTLTLRSQVKGNMTFSELLEDVKTTMLEAYAHQEVPFEKVVDAVVKTRDMSRNPLFQVIFSFQNTPEIPELRLGNLSLSVEAADHTTSKFDLAFMITETSTGLHGIVEYNTDLYKGETIERMISHYSNLLRSIAASPESKTSRLEMLNATEERTLLIDFNDTAAAYPKEKSIVDLFQEQVVQRPEAIATVFGDEQLTYKELNNRSNQLAHYLQKKGVKAETLVPICLERSLEMIIGILGVLKAGGAYVPIDPEYPADRISYMLEDTGAKLVLSSKASREKLSGSNIDIIELDSDWEKIKKEKDSNLNAYVSPDQLAYVIYTSGSTGKPKGVMIEHRGVVNLGISQANALRLKPGMKTLQFASFGFDASCYEIFNTFLSGGCLVLCTKEDILSAELFKQLVDKNQVELAAIPPSFQQTLDDDTLRILRTIVSGGESLNGTTGRYIQSQGVRLINGYGPTEITVCASLSDDPIRLDNIITIGKPISNTKIYILSGDTTLSPVGVNGEICIGGAGLARGYLNSPELTAEKFIKDPFSKEEGARLYRTGDLGRWLTDGNIEYLGRMDDQVKIRGYRIELGEIENILNQSGLISQAVVLAKGDNGNKRLLGYVVPKGTFDKQEVQNYLSTKLPEYMVPALWVELDHLPITANGKIDRKVLSNFEAIGLMAGYVAPRTTTEALMVEIWQKVLEVDKIGIEDNFFELGGHSMLALRLVSVIRKKFGLELPISDVFVYPTIANLTRQLESKNKITSQLLLPIKITGNKMPLYIICGAGGTVFKFIDFVKLLDPEQPVYGLQQPSDSKELETFPNTIEGIAELYLKEILKQNPHGPYALTGHCLGGNIAFEMAIQLKKMDKKVAMLGMFDASIIEEEEIIPATLNNYYHIPNIITNSFSTVSLKIRFEMYLLLKHPKQALLYKIEKVKSIIGVTESTPEEIELESFNKASGVFETAIRSYKMRYYEDEILVFYAKEHYYFIDRDKRILYKKINISNDTKNSWKRYAKSVKIYEIDGEHSTIFDPRYALGLAKILQKHLDNAHIGVD
jgi:amino acid adenylation domain-containing protein